MPTLSRTLVLASFLGAAPAAAAPVAADLESLRSVTYPVNPGLTYEGIENFRELYVDPFTIGRELRPSAPPALPDVPEGAAGPSVPPLASLPIINDHNIWATVTVEGKEIGIIGPLTTGALHNVPSGTYKVHFKYHSDFERETTASTLLLAGPIVPGGPGARVALGQEVPAQPKAAPPAKAKVEQAAPAEAPEAATVQKAEPKPAEDGAKTLDKDKDKAPAPEGGGK